MKINVYSERIINYIKAVLIVLLVIIEVVVCAQTVTRYAASPNLLINLFVVIACCAALAVVETVDSFVFKNFVAKMIFYGVDAALLLIICIFTGNSLLSTLYCIVLTQIYMNVEKFKDKLILFLVSCGLFSGSFVLGWLLANPGATIFNSAVSLTSGVLFGLLAISVDFVVVQFLLEFHRTNRRLSAALKEAEESRAALKEAAVYEERNRIAKDIHDNAGHSMTTVIMQTEAAKLLIDKDPSEAKNRIISANIQARNALEQMRESVHLLAGRRTVRPIEEEMGEIIAQTIDGTDVKVRSNLCAATPSEEQCHFLCSSLKECLSNGIRHGRATAFYVELKQENGFTVLYVSDNGGGVEGGKVTPGFGLGGIVEKAKQLGGSAQFFGEKDEGFEVTIKVPCGKEEKND